MPSPLGPYRSSPRSVQPLAARAPKGVAIGLTVVLVIAGAWIAPGTTAAVIAALLLYVAAPWFVTRARGA